MTEGLHLVPTPPPEESVPECLLEHLATAGFYQDMPTPASRQDAEIAQFPMPHVAGAIELLREFGQLNETDRGRLIAIAKVMRATA